MQEHGSLEKRFLYETYAEINLGFNIKTSFLSAAHLSSIEQTGSVFTTANIDGNSQTKIIFTIYIGDWF